MKKLIFLLLPLLSLFAGDVYWHDSYKEAQEEAIELKRPMLIFFSQAGCKSCDVMEDIVLQEENIADYLDKHYVCMHLDIRDNDAPKDLQVPFTPVFHFTDTKGELIKESLVGKQKEAFFLQYLQLK